MGIIVGREFRFLLLSLLGPCGRSDQKYKLSQRLEELERNLNIQMKAKVCKQKNNTKGRQSE